MRSSATLFFTAFGFFFLFFGGHFVMGDHLYRVAWAKALLDHGGNDISSYIPGAKYSSWGVGHTLIHVPFVLMSRVLENIFHRSCEGPVNMLVYVINAALGVVLIHLVLLKHGVERRWARLGSLILGVASLWFPYSKLEYGESLVTTLLLGMWLALPNSALLGGFLGGIAITIRAESVLWVIITAITAYGGKRPPGKIFPGLVAGLCFLVGSNWMRDWSELFHETGATFPLPLGVYSILFSAGKSLFLFSPLLLLYPFSLKFSLENQKTRNLALWSICLLAGQISFYGNFWNWAGDDSWGERFLTPAVMVAQIVVVSFFHGRRFRFLYPIAILGFLIQLPPVLMGPHTTLMLNHELNPLKTNPPYLSKSPITLSDIQYNPRYSQLTSTTELLLYKITGRVPENARAADQGSTWLQSFSPPPTRDQIAWDIFWLRPPHRH